MRLIDADAGMEIFEKKAQGSMFDGTLRWVIPISELDALPTIDAAPVRHGRWIMTNDHEDGTADFECSNCEYDDTFFTKILEIYIKYCPHCGAKMDL